MKKTLVVTFAAVALFAVAASADLMSGVWSTNVCMNGAGVFTSFDSSVALTYEICNWTLGAVLLFDETGWTDVVFTADGVLGAFTIGSEIIFDPTTATLGSWATEISISLAGVDIDLGFTIDSVGNMSLITGLGGDVGLCTLGVSAEFGGFCVLDYVGICLDFGFPFTCVEWIEVSACFGCGTFEGICFDIDGLQLAGIDWLIFNLEICFDDGELGKTFTFTPALSLGSYDCITIYAELVEGADFEFDGIDVYGVEIYYEWDDGVYFQSVSSFEIDKNDDLIHASGLYWEKICIGTVGDSCCGGGFDFSLCVYFEETSSYLFDVGLVESTLGFSIGSNFTLHGSISAGTAGLIGLCIGFDVSW